MPGNVQRHSRHPAPPGAVSARLQRLAKREIFIHAGRIVIRARLLDTATAGRIWQTLPIYSTAETWGEAVHFETLAETGRETGAKSIVAAGEIAFWTERDRVIVGFGKTPLSKPGEIRLPAPCNIWAMALDDVAQLRAVQPGQQIAILEAAS